MGSENDKGKGKDPAALVVDVEKGTVVETDAEAAPTTTNPKKRISGRPSAKGRSGRTKQRSLPLPLASRRGSNAIPDNYNQIVLGMDEAYCVVNDEHACHNQARLIFARRAALATFVINMTFLTCGALFFASQTDWDPVDVALFTVYTVTSAGYGHVDIPETPLFRLFLTVYILLGLALMATMMAQVYQYLEMEAMRLQHASDKAETLQRGIDQLKKSDPASNPHRTIALRKLEEQQRNESGTMGKILWFFTRLVVFSIENPWGDFLHRIGSLIFLAALGAVTVGIIEGWEWYTSVYWSVVSLTTVGYGDVVPQTVAGKAFTTVWLPLNLFFLSILFCSVGHYYLMFSERRTNLIQARIQEARSKDPSKSLQSADHTSIHEASSNEDGFVNPEMKHVQFKNNMTTRPRKSASFRSVDLAMNRRFFGANLETMKDVLDVVHKHSPDHTGKEQLESIEIGELSNPSAIVLHGETPNFLLRVKVKERIAYIVAEEVAGSASTLTTSDKDGMLSLFLEGTVEAGNKWMIPRAARRAFRAVAFEALLFVGESTLVKDGEHALHLLSPMEFHRIFSPLLVAMGDADSLQNWLTTTDVLWENEKCKRESRRMSFRSLHCGHKDFAKNCDQIEFPTNHAEGFHLFHGT